MKDEIQASMPHADITVVTPAYNCAKTIQRCVDSVAQQELAVKEHIIVDDGSTDDTAKVLAELAQTYDFLKVVRQPNQGAGVARNKAIEMASGRFIAFLDADDFWLPGKTKSQHTFMLEENCPLSFGDYYIVTGDAVDKRDRVFQPPQQVSYNDLLTSCPLGCLTVAYDQQALGKIYMPELRRGQDWALWLKITRDGTQARKYPGQHAVYYVQTGSLSNNKLKKFFDVFKVYSESENMGFLASFYYTLVHSLKVLAAKKRGR